MRLFSSFKEVATLCVNRLFFFVYMIKCDILGGREVGVNALNEPRN
jgi:hypothetical protein